MLVTASLPPTTVPCMRNTNPMHHPSSPTPKHTAVLTGTGNYIFSARRGSWLITEASQVQDTQAQVAATRAGLDALRRSYAEEAKLNRALAGAALGLSVVTTLGLLAVCAGTLAAVRRRHARGFRGGVKGQGVTKAVDDEAQEAVGGYV